VRQRPASQCEQKCDDYAYEDGDRDGPSVAVPGVTLFVVDDHLAILSRGRICATSVCVVTVAGLRRRMATTPMGAVPKTNERVVCTCDRTHAR
jgi:hypothetical protein